LLISRWREKGRVPTKRQLNANHPLGRGRKKKRPVGGGGILLYTTLVHTKQCKNTPRKIGKKEGHIL